MLSNLNDLELTPLQVFRDYIQMKLHFQGHLEWNGTRTMEKLTAESLAARRDGVKFHIIADLRLDREDFVQQLISAFIKDRNFWIGAFGHQEVIKVHKDRMKRWAVKSRNFEIDIGKLRDYMHLKGMTPKDMLYCSSELDAPKVFKLKNRIMGGITEETLALLDWYFDMTRNRHKALDPYWADYAMTISRYKYICRPSGDEKAWHDRQIYTLLGQ